MDSRHPHTTPPQDRIGRVQKISYGIGALANNLIGAAFGSMVIVLNLGLGLNPATVGLLLALPRIVDAMMDPVMGYVSDHTRSRFGRRRPYIFAGALLAGLVFVWIWQIPVGRSESFYFWHFLSIWTVFYLVCTVYTAPWVALGYEMTADYHERTRLMAYSNWIGQIAWVLAPWCYKFMENDAWFSNALEGAAALGLVVGASVAVMGVIPALVCREKQVLAAAGPAASGEGLARTLRQNAAKFFHDFSVTLQNRPFRKLCAAGFLVFNGFMLISAFSSYIIIYYVFAGDKDAGATYMGWLGVVASVSTFLVIPFVTWLSTRIGKQNAFVACMAVSTAGYSLKIFCYNPSAPWMLLLPAPLAAFGLGSLFTLVGSMIADVCDLDELQTGSRREGMFGSIFWWFMKLGLALAVASSGALLNLTGFDVRLGGMQSSQTLLWMRVFDIGVPIITSLAALGIIATLGLSEQGMRDVRAELERRRGRMA